METVHMLVTLKIPDATALTAQRTLHEMGYEGLRDLRRALYYKFTITHDPGSFMKRIANVDILVNANKHAVSFEMPTEGVPVLVTDKDANSSLLKTLTERLGIKGIASIEQGVLWTFDIRGNEKNDLAKKMTKDLLANIHYQNFEVLR